MARGKQSDQPEERRYGVRQVAVAADRVTRRAFGRRGFAMTELLTRWPMIAGESLARHSAPERLRFPQGKAEGGALWVRVDGAMGLELQHLQPLLIERINAHCGFRAVRELRIVQGPIGRPQARIAAKRRPLAPAQLQALQLELAAVADPELRAALARLGGGVLGRQNGG